MRRLRLAVNNTKERKCSNKEPKQIICKVCSGSHYIKTKIAPRYDSGKIKGGTDALICVTCLASGKITRIV